MSAPNEAEIEAAALAYHASAVGPIAPWDERDLAWRALKREHIRAALVAAAAVRDAAPPDPLTTRLAAALRAVYVDWVEAEHGALSAASWRAAVRVLAEYDRSTQP